MLTLYMTMLGWENTHTNTRIHTRTHRKDVIPKKDSGLIRTDSLLTNLAQNRKSVTNRNLSCMIHHILFRPRQLIVITLLSW